MKKKVKFPGHRRCSSMFYQLYRFKYRNNPSATSVSHQEPCCSEGSRNSSPGARVGQLPSNALDAEKQEFLASLPEVPELGCLSYQCYSKKLNGNGGIMAIMAIMASRIVFHTCNRLQPVELMPDPSFWTLPRVPCSAPKSSKSLEGCHPQQLDEGRTAPRPHDTSKEPNAAPCFPC